MSDEHRVTIPAGRPELQAGGTVGTFRLDRLISRGETAEVWLACAADGVQVAVKVLRADRASEPSMVEIFEEECRLALALVHPNIVRGRAHGVDGGVPFLVSDLVVGTTWLHALQRAREIGSPPHPEAAAWIAANVARALHHAHTLVDPAAPRGALHRDVDPSNVLLDVDGTPRLIDFGVARALPRTMRAEGAAFGRARFLAPEQLRDKELDARVDLFGLGVSLYVASLGRYPYDEPDLKRQIAARIEVPPAPPAEVDSEYPSELAVIVARLMAIQPADRYPDAAEAADALEAFAHKRGIRRSTVAAWFATLFRRDEERQAEVGAVDPTTVSDRFSLRAANVTTPVLVVPRDAPGRGPPTLVPVATQPRVPTVVPQEPRPSAARAPPRSGGVVYAVAAAAIVAVGFGAALTAVFVVAPVDPAALEQADAASARETLRIVRGLSDPSAALDVLGRADRGRWPDDLVAEGRALEATLRVQRGAVRWRHGDRYGALEDARAALALVPSHPDATRLLETALPPTPP